MDYSWIFFDLDGTLIDSIKNITYYVNKALNDMGYKADYTTSDVANFIGDGSYMLINRALKKFNKSEDIIIKVHEKYKNLYTNNPYYLIEEFPEVTNSLLTLKKRFKLGVISNKPEEDTKKIVEAFFPNIFTLVLGGNNRIKLKPSNEIIEEIKAKEKISNKDILYVGDMKTDENFAINSKIDFVYASYGYGKNVEFYKYKIKKIEELLLLY